MRIIEVPNTLTIRILNALEDFEAITKELRRLNSKIDRIEGREVQESIDLAALTQKVKAGTALDESIKTLVEGIAEELRNNPDPKVQALADKLHQQTAALSAAVIANTSS